MKILIAFHPKSSPHSFFSAHEWVSVQAGDIGPNVKYASIEWLYAMPVRGEIQYCQ